MRIVAERGLSEILTMVTELMVRSNSGPCEPRDMVFVSLTEVNNSGAIECRDHECLRYVWIIYNDQERAFQVYFNDRESAGAEIVREKSVFYLGRSAVVETMEAYVLRGEMPSAAERHH